MVCNCYDLCILYLQQPQHIYSNNVYIFIKQNNLMYLVELIDMLDLYICQ